MAQPHVIKFVEFLDILKEAFESSEVGNVRESLVGLIGMDMAMETMNGIAVNVNKAVVNAYNKRLTKKYDAVQKLKAIDEKQREAEQMLDEIASQKKALEIELFGPSPTTAASFMPRSKAATSQIRPSESESRALTTTSAVDKPKKTGRPPTEYDEEGKAIKKEPIRKRPRKIYYDDKGNELPPRGPGRQKRQTDEQGNPIELSPLRFDQFGNPINQKDKARKASKEPKEKKVERNPVAEAAIILANEPKYHTPAPMKDVNSAYQLNVVSQVPTVKQWSKKDVRDGDLNAGLVPVNEITPFTKGQSAQGFVESISDGTIAVAPDFIYLNNHKCKPTKFLRDIRACRMANETLASITTVKATPRKSQSKQKTNQYPMRANLM